MTALEKDKTNDEKIVIKNDDSFTDKEFLLLNGIFKKIENEKELEESLRIDEGKFKGLDKLKTDEDVMQYVMENDKRNTLEYFNEDYEAWSKNTEKNTKLLSLHSRFRSFLGNTFYRTPESMGMPFYYYWTDHDKLLCTPFHYPKLRPSTYTEHRNRLFVNFFGGREFRRKSAKYIAIGFFIAGATVSIIKPIIKVPYLYVHGIYEKHSRVNVIEDKLELDIATIEKNTLDAKNKNIDLAKKAKEKYESGVITAEQFNSYAESIKKEDVNINERKNKAIESLKESANTQIKYIQDEKINN